MMVNSIRIVINDDMDGFHRHGGIPQIAGWFLIGKIPSFEMDDDWEYPHRCKPRNVMEMLWTCYGKKVPDGGNVMELLMVEM